MTNWYSQRFCYKSKTNTLKQKGNFLNEMIWLKFEAEETLKWYSQEKERKIEKLSEKTVDESAETKQAMFLHAKLVKLI